MKVLILTESYLPNLGGVEKHIAGTLPHLQKARLEIDVISKRALLGEKSRIKFLGLLQIWWAMLKQIKLIKTAEVVFIHDVFIYYLPFLLIFPRKKIITTFHGWEKIFPIPAKNIFYKKLAQKFSAKTISVGEYINKYYSLNSKNNYLTYGAVEFPAKEISLDDKKTGSFLFVGRLEEDTGLSIFLEFLDILLAKNNNFSVKFCGDGPLRIEAQKYGQVLGFTNPKKYLAEAEVCFAGGYLSILEAMVYKNIVLSAYQNPLKKDYLEMSPFASGIAYAKDASALYENYLSIQKQAGLISDNYQLAKEHNFEKLAALYIKAAKIK
jgi:glycosyltransferase involved in cell wall biosynthesis